MLWFTGSSDVLCLQQIYKEKLEFTSRHRTLLTACWLLSFMLFQPSQTVLWVDRSGQQFQNCAGG